MENQKLSQCDLIKNALEDGQQLTGLDILNRFGCLNYKGRIADLRRRGVNIKTEMVKTQNHKRIAIYSLVQ